MGKSFKWDGEKAVEVIDGEEPVYVWNGEKAVLKKKEPLPSLSYQRQKTESLPANFKISSTDGQSGLKPLPISQEQIETYEKAAPKRQKGLGDIIPAESTKQFSSKQSEIKEFKRQKKLEAEQKEIGYAEKAIAEGRDIEEAAALFRAQQDPEFAAQFEKLQESGYMYEQPIGDILSGKPATDIPNRASTIFGEATRGQNLYNFLSNPRVQEVAKKNPQLLSQMRGEAATLVNHFPEFGKQYLSTLISNRMAEMGINNGLLNSVTKAELDTVVEQLKSEGVIGVGEEEFIKREIRPRMGLENFARAAIGKPAIKTTGLIENALEGAVSGARDLGQGVAEITGIRPLIQGEQGALSSDLERDARKVAVKPANIWQEATTYGGQIAGQSLVTGGVGKGLQAYNLIKNPAVALSVAGGMQAYGNYAPEARKMFPHSQLSQRGYTTIMAGIEAATENIFKDTKVLKGLMGDISPQIKKTITDFTQKNIDAAAAKLAIQGAIKNALNKVPEAGKYFGKAVGENVIEEVSAEVGNQVTSGIFEGKPIDEIIDAEKLGEASRQAFLGSGFIGILTTRADMKDKQGISAKQIYLMARDPETWSKEIRESSTDPADTNDIQDKLENLEYAANLVKELDANTQMSEKQKAKFLLTSLQNKIKGEQQTTATDPVLKAKAQEEITSSIKANDKIKEDLLSGKDDGTFEGDKSDDANKDEAKLFEEIYNAAPEGYKATLAAAKTEGNILGGLDYMKDKFAENPIKFREDFGDEITDKVLKQTPTEKLREKLDYLIENNTDDPNISVLDKIISEREAKQIPNEAVEQPQQPSENKGDIKSAEHSSDIPKNETIIDTYKRVETGKPISFYGYRVAKGDYFNEKGGMFLSDVDMAISYAGKRPGEIRKYRVDLKNPLKIKSKEHYIKELAEKGDETARKLMPDWETVSIEDGGIDSFAFTGDAIAEVDSFMKKKITETGHDGVINIGQLEIVVFDKEAVGKIDDSKVSILSDIKKNTFNKKRQEGDESATPIEFESAFTNKPEGTPPIGEPPSGSRIHVQRPATELSHSGLQDVANEFSLPDVQTRDRKSDVQLRQDAVNKINEWKDKGEYSKRVDGLIQKAEAGEVLTDEQRVILEQHLANISQELRELPKNSPEFDIKLAEVKRLKDAGEKTRSEAGAALRIPTFRSRPQDLTDYYVAEMEAAGVDKLTEKQKETAEKEFDEISKTEAALNEKIAALQEENAKLKAEQAVKGAKAKTKSGQKKDFKAERTKIFEDIKDKLKKSRSDTQATIVPYAKELFAIAPDVAKLMRSYVEQGVTELSDLIKNIHTDLKDAIPEVTEKDVRDIIAGEYNEKRTRNELAAKLRDLRTEASLLNQIEALEVGEEPSSERKKIERNQKLKDLRDKVKGHDLSKLADTKKRIQGQIEKIEEQLKSGEFAKEEKQPLKLDDEAKDLQDRLIKLKQERERRILELEQAKASRWDKIQKAAVNVLGVPRSLMSSVDFSAPLRQSFVATVSNPDLAAKAGAKMFQAAFSQKAYDRWFDDLSKSDRYDLMIDSKLGITNMRDPKLTAREEEYMSNLAQKIPFVGSLVKGSERAYSMYLNKMRVDVFNRLADKMQENGKTWENSKEQYQQLAKFVNNITGRGDLGEALDKAAPLLNTLFFSPRLMASRVNTMTYLAQPRFYKTVPAEARKAYYKGLVSTAGLGLLVLGLAKAAGADTEDDPRSPDFGKIKSGNTRWDIWGGHQQYIRLVAQMVSGKKKSSTSGNITEMKPTDRFVGSGLSFLRGKLSPVAGIATDVLMGQNVLGQKLGEDISWDKYALDHALPLNVTGIAEAIKDQGVKGLLTVGVPSTFGIGVQTYEGSKVPQLKLPDLVQQDFKRTEDNGFEVPQPKATLSIEGYDVELNKDQKEEFKTIINENRQKVIDDYFGDKQKETLYKKIPDIARKKVLETLYDAGRQKAVAEMLQKHPELITQVQDNVRKLSEEAKKQMEERK